MKTTLLIYTWDLQGVHIVLSRRQITVKESRILVSCCSHFLELSMQLFILREKLLELSMFSISSKNLLSWWRFTSSLRKFTTPMSLQKINMKSLTKSEAQRIMLFLFLVRLKYFCYESLNFSSHGDTRSYNLSSSRLFYGFSVLTEWKNAEIAKCIFINY